MRRTLLACCALLLAACGKAPEAPVATVAPAAPAVVERSGEQVYAAHCRQCHEGLVSKAPHKDILSILAPRSILETLESGVMKQQGAVLSADEKKSVAEFITGGKLVPAVDVAALLACPSERKSFDFGAPPTSLGWGVDHANSHAYPASVTAIGPANVGRLQLKWAFAHPDANRARSQPVLAGGALFTGSANGSVYALDADSGCVRWVFKASAEVRTGIVVDGWKAGDTAARPRLYFGDLIGNIYAIDAVDGTLVWRDRPDDHHALTITAAPVRFEDRVFFALSALEVTAAADPAYPCCSFRGAVTAYDAATGKRLWLTRTIASEATEVSRNNIGTPRLAPSGAPVWSGPALDVAGRRLIVGTGENFSSPADANSDAIKAFDIDTGKEAWSWQATAGDAWNMGCEMANKTNCPPENGPDFDFGSGPLVATLADGARIVLAGQKSGSIHALDAASGKLLWQRKLGRGGIQGGTHFGMAMQDGAVFVPISDFYGGPRWPGEARPGLYALDIASGEPKWEALAADVCNGRAHCNPGISAAIATVPGLVFAGSMDGHLRAHDTATGTVVWDYDSVREYAALGGLRGQGGSFSGGSAPVFKGRMMYVNSGYGIYNHMPGNVLLAFELPASP